MTGTTKAIWGAAALVTGATILTGVVVYDRVTKKIGDDMFYYKNGYAKKDALKRIKSKGAKNG